jgi:hypothetical protein
MMATPSWEQLNEAIKLWGEGRPWPEVQQAMGKLPDETTYPAASDASQPDLRRLAS